jgi:16S rRNA (adenine1518-N6/adenine1519-N6)-dimethyltransferase
VPRRDDRHAAKKSLGQNFLVDPNLQRKIVEAIRPGPDDEVLEIGPGRGALTTHLARSVRRLILVELDDTLAAALADRYADDPSVTMVHGDILKVDLARVSDDPAALKVIGNIPYNITTPIIFHLLERHPRPREIVLMVQREVADRILAEPGGKAWGALAVAIRLVASVERVVNVGRAAFRPVPDVESTVIRIVPFQPPRITPEMEREARIVTRIAFGQRRKQLQKVLRAAFRLSPSDVDELATETGIDLRARPETLGPDAFVRLAEALAARGAGPPAEADREDTDERKVQGGRA